MSEEAVPTPEELADYYRRLAVSAASLNAASDEFTKALAPVDSALQWLNIGVECWARVKAYEDDENDPTAYRYNEIGYAKVNGKWGIALRVISGSEMFNRHDEERWLFNEAPRLLRVDSIPKLTALLERLIKKSDSTTEKIKETTGLAREYAAAVERAASELKTAVQAEKAARQQQRKLAR
jgi:hypothetical protein